MNVIETKKLTKYYGKTVGIKDLDLTVNEGEILGFIGPNGAGKSTTIRLLLSLIYPTSGSAAIFGKDIITDGPEIKKDIGYLPSEVFYYDKMRVIDLLNYSASFYGIDATKRINELAELLKLDLHKKIDELSFGNKKKVGIVQGLLHNPKLIILDEPTGGIDPLIQKNFFELLRKEADDGKTIFFSSHILSEVQHLCNRVAMVKNGELILVEPMEKIMENNYKRVHLAFKSKISKKNLEIKGISDLEIDGNKANFFYRGNINTIIDKLSKLDLINLDIEAPDLEEIFLHYYR